MHTRIFLTALLTALFVATSEADYIRVKRIINGTLAPSVPWAARLITSNSGYMIYSQCGGSLINAQWVLTAKHCLINPDGTDSGVKQIAVGNNNYARGKLRRVAAKYFVSHTKFQYLADDIALIKLDRPVYGVTPVKIQLQNNLDYGGMWATIYGWGHTVEGAGHDDSSTVDLRATSVILVDRRYCEPNKICFDPNLTRTNACVGDSGGPMVYNYNNEQVLLGVTSTVSAQPLCSGAILTGYMSVPYYANWIRSTIRNY
ncbi:chymotrypsin-1-like [Chrysoperla carnea]|uniref:chymotrypsin-1-like n=1 Tax=Chrysoperla carnea TaxID=189513 RepID=UPI001D08D038|nr:chymotrypsin-1-like [Chrysoperla carnea]